MQIQTPKKYRGAQRRNVIGCRRVLFWIFSLIVISAGIIIYQNRATLQPRVYQALDSLVADMEQGVATIIAPTATPTRDPGDFIIRANNEWERGSVNESVDIYEDIIDSAPNDVLAHERIIVGNIITGRTEEALKYAEKIVNADPFSPDAWAVRAWALAYNNQINEAIISARYALELDPDHTRAKVFLAEAYLNNEQVDLALQFANDALEEDPENIEGYRIRGRIFRTGLFDFEAALQDFQTGYDLALQNSPSLALLLALNISDMQAVDGDHDASIATLEAILEVNPQNTSALYRIADIYLRIFGDPNKAITYLNRCLDFSQTETDCHYLLGRAQYRLEEYSAAAESFARAIENGSINPYHYYWAGWSKINLGRCADALPYLQEGYQIALQGSDETIINDIATILPQCDPNFRSVRQAEGT